MAPDRGCAPDERSRRGAGAGRCLELPPGGRPPCAEGAKAERPHHAADSYGESRRPPSNLARHRFLGRLRSRARGRASGARRAPRAFKVVVKVLTSRAADSGDSGVLSRLMLDTACLSDAD
jgi:hypothetical protein